MGNLEITILLVVALIGLGWVVARVLGGLGAGGESSARADTLAGGSGFAPDHIDTLRNNERQRSAHHLTSFDQHGGSDA